MRAYYNEHDPGAAAWLRELIAAGLIADGVVDERDIREVRGADLAGFRQVHLFAGIGGWSLALRMVGWGDARHVWTGSCPCQPFSSAGKQEGEEDPRHLWPEMRRLVEECGPAIVFGEQVASGAGRVWLAGVRGDLEALGYGVGAGDLCAAGVGAPHIRQRLFWGAVRGADSGGFGGAAGLSGSDAREEGKPGVTNNRGREGAGGVADADGERFEIGRESNGGSERSEQQPSRRADAGGRDEAGALGDAEGGGCGVGGDAAFARGGGHAVGASWAGCRVVECRDGKWRRVPAEPALFPLADGVPGRVGLLRGAGNAIVPQVAARFVEAFVMAMEDAGVRL